MNRRSLLSRSTLAITFAAALLMGCSSTPVTDYAQQTPVLELRDYFNDTLDAYGIFTDRSGKVVKRFTVVMNCRWEGPPGQETGVLDEDFSYSDGTRQRRVWTLRRTADGRYSGTADDVVGEAVGQEKGNAFRWGYTLKLPVDGRVIEVSFDLAFRDVITACAKTRRPGGWISAEFINGYTALHEAGHAHSVECWRANKLVGGVYGVAVGGLFAGESMFHRADDASKVALFHLVTRLRERGFKLFDTQMVTPVTRQLGATEIPRDAYLMRLAAAVSVPAVF